MRTALSFLVLSVLFSSGCGIFGRRQVDHPIDRDALAKVQKGMPKEEVTQLLGAPQEILFSNKALDPLVEHAYIYEYSTAKYTGVVLAIVNFGNVDEKRDRVVIWLGPDGKVTQIGASLKAADAAYDFPFGQ